MLCEHAFEETCHPILNSSGKPSMSFDEFSEVVSASGLIDILRRRLLPSRQRTILHLAIPTVWRLRQLVWQHEFRSASLPIHFKRPPEQTGKKSKNWTLGFDDPLVEVWTRVSALTVIKLQIASMSVHDNVNSSVMGPSGFSWSISQPL